MPYNAIQTALNAIMPAVRATGLLSSLCTIQEHDGTFTVAGQPTVGDAHWDDVAGLIDIACMNPPEGLVNAIRAREKRMIDEELSESSWHCLLDDYYPTINTGQRAVVNGIASNIAGVESDSQHKMTRLKLEYATI